MALVPCKECGKEVSSKAFKCPNCGARLRKARRGPIGFIIKWTFILFNILMIIWTIGAVNVTSEALNASQTAAEQAGAAIGSGIGISIILTLWVIGDIILGILTLLSKPKE